MIIILVIISTVIAHAWLICKMNKPHMMNREYVRIIRGWSRVA
jgi:hypothetical protein